MPMARTWNGLTLLDQIHRASGRALVGIGMVIVVDAKRMTHVVSGTLSRSIHASPLMAMHDDDEAQAEAGADLFLQSFDLKPTDGEFGPIIEVGSWIDYACVEWIGRRHPGINEAMEASRGIRVANIVKQAFREEGLQ